MSSGPRPTHRIAKVTYSSPHCHIEVHARQDAEGRISLRSRLEHAADPSECGCRLHPDAAQETRNDAVLLRHVCGLEGVDGAVMASVFAKLKVGSAAVEPDHLLLWDGDGKTWIPRS